MTAPRRRPYDAIVMPLLRVFAPALILAAWSACSGGGPERPADPARATRPAPPATAIRPQDANGADGQLPGVLADGIAARINNEIITWKDVDDSLRNVKGEITPELRLSKRRELAEEKLFLQAARQHGVQVSEQELEDYLRRERKNFRDEDDFERWLRLQGITRTEYRELRRRTYLVFKLYRHLLQKSFTNPDEKTPGLMIDSVPPEEIRRYYDDHREQFKAIENVSAVRVAFQFSTEREKEYKRALAESVLRKLREGADPYLVAHFYSDVRRGAGGEVVLRGVSREDASKFFSPATVRLLFDTMKVGETSDIVEDGSTLNIFRLEQRINQREETFAEAQGRIRSFLENQKREENRRKLRDHLVRQAYVWPPDLFASE